MKFSSLNPLLSIAFQSTKEVPVWILTFDCAKCRTRTDIAVSGRVGKNNIWCIVPDPLTFVPGPSNVWDSVTIQPSLNNLPHPRQIVCDGHCTITDGQVILQ